MNIASFQESFAYCPEMAFISDPGGAIVGWNEALAHTFGPVIRDGVPLSELVHPEDRNAFAAEWARLTDRSGTIRFECRMQAADGFPRRLSCSVRKSSRREEIYGMLSKTSVGDPPPAPAADFLAEEAREELALAAKRKRDSELLYHIERNLPIVVWVADRQGVLSHHAGLAIERIGIKSGDWVGGSIHDLSAEQGEGLDNLRRALDGEVVHTSAEAHGMSWENWVFPIADEQGRITGAFGVSLDVTEMRRAERELSAKIALIQRQEEVIRHLGTPIIQIWDRVLALPLVGSIDSKRAAGLMSNVLAEIVRTGAHYAILDLTGVDGVDTTTAAHLVNLIAAVRLLGTEGIITGIRPTVAQTMIALGLNLTEIVTLANLREGLKLCMRRMKQTPKSVAQ
jgi:rsbT co-antagonist protein RsbR